jgi:exonuclease SbcC
VHHPSPILIKDFTSDIEQLSQQIDQYKKQLDELNALRTSVTGLLENKVRLNDNYKLVNNNLVKANSIHLITSSSQPDKKYGVNDIDLFSENEKISRETRIHLDEIEKLIQEAYTFIELESENVNKIEIEYKKLQLNQGALKITIINNSEGLKEITPKVYENISAEAIEIEKNQILEDIQTNEATLIDTQKIADNLKSEQTLLIGKMSGIDESIKNIEKLQEQTREQIKLLVDKGQLKEPEIIAILKKQLDVTALRKLITENRRSLHLLQGEIAGLEKLVGGVSFNESIFKEKTETFNNTKELLTKATEKKGNLEGQLKNQKEALEKKMLLQSQQSALIIRATDIATLKKLFNASGFVEFVSKRYLQNVVALANNRFGKMVRQKFGMELSEKGDFIVRDYLNGGKTRLLKSLSGGQTFQAALCLALALSESIQRNAGIDQHFFFLDEGFGSLDKENLQIVLSTLQSLRQENRVVGLISHVEELQQEIDVFLKVENDPVRGTMIKESWKN